MRALSRVFLAAASGAIVFALACGGDATGPSASSVTGVAGDNQLAGTGAQLPFPLSFTVLGSSGQPLSGVSVDWTVSPTGGATFTPQRSVSNAQGVVTTTVRLAGSPGEIVITATVPGVPPVVFHATILDPCEILNAYTFGATVAGTLAAGDCDIQSHFVDFYALDLPAGQQNIRINMASTTLDPYVELGRITSDEFVGFDDDIETGVNTNSQLDAIVGEGGAFYILSTSFDPGQAGTYSLSATSRTRAFDNCELVWVTRGVSVVDSIRTSDCADTTGGSIHYVDFVAIWAEPGTVLTITQRSSEIDPKLQFLNGQGFLLVENDDSAAGNSTAFIVDTVTASGPYVILPSTSVAGQTGTYTLIVSPAGPASSLRASAAAVRGRQQLRFGTVRLPEGVGKAFGLSGRAAPERKPQRSAP